ncbi:MAG: alpha/beta fold hydrolase [Sphingomicrobium sp.]
MNEAAPPLAYFESTDGQRIAYRLRPRAPGGIEQPTLLFLPGYASDMAGAKALALDQLAAARGVAMLRFDYSGTGESPGSFADGTLAGWIDQAAAAVDRLTEGPLIVVGSSMGGWIALHLALRRPDRVAALVGIAAAPDFTDWGFSPAEKSALNRDGLLERPNPYGGEAQRTTRAFLQSGEALRLLDAPIAVECPVRLVHGDADADVPIEVAFRLMRGLRSADVQLTIVKGGGHRLSAPHEIDLIVRTVAALLEPAQ